MNKVTTRNYFQTVENRNGLRKFSFTNRIVNIWNSLPNAVVDVNSVDLFQSIDLTTFKCSKMSNMITLSTSPVPEIDLSLTQNIIEKLY